MRGIMIRRFDHIVLRSCISPWFCVLAFAAFCILPLQARADDLYGLTYDGYLVQIDTSTATPTSVRARLPLKYQPYHSLTFYNGSFLATTGNALPDGGCWVLAFGVGSGDEVYQGKVSGFCPRALAVDSSGDLYTGGSSTCGSSTCLQLKQLNPTTFAVTNIANTISMNANDYAVVDGLAFVGSSNAYMSNVGNFAMDYRQLTLSGGAWSATYQSLGELSSNAHGFAYDSSSALLYGVVGYDESASSSATSKLYSIASPYYGGGSANPHLIGTVTGYPGMVGITMAPPTNQISSPSLPTGAKEWEPVRELIVD
jgi:hypothetical protein